MKWIAMCAALLSATATSAYANQAGDDYDVIFAPSPQAQRAEQGVLIGLERYINKTIAVGAFGTVLVREGNEDWQQAEVPTSVLLTALHYIDANTIWASGHDGVLIKSTDGGQSWQRMMDGYQLLEMELDWLQQREDYLTEALENADDEEQAYEYEYLLDELSFLVQAASIQQEVGPTKPFLDVFFIDNQHGFAIGAYGTMLETTDGGSNWSMVNERLENPTAFHLNKMITNERGDLFIIGEAGQLFRSEDSGANWDLLDSPYHGSLFGGLFDQQERLWVYGLRGSVFVSDDNGDSFRQIDANTRYNLNSGTVMADGTVVLAGHSGTMVFFDPQTLQPQRYEHSSNVPLSDVLQDAGNQMIMVGRSGLMQFIYPATAR
ncbi:WD40/YVTN/BNR-like repeat-containing protein [Aliidiomarina soli]|uniref:Photosynthesis system II assembly factor Ycf48/Hcf136-like domain-containing protein n=1 Tax=Aliidiomarina soli TaxID=1928574 RepID=A0A432WMJ8_9GAMM|nr:YCF48-related protein [Aliidiomarina soli]RUO35042.1 hypothetical protein CWE14_03335 [Aliidiomarina soli]